jgi:hypothetical protein
MIFITLHGNDGGNSSSRILFKEKKQRKLFDLFEQLTYVFE